MRFNFSETARDVVLILAQGPMRRSHMVKMTSPEVIQRLEGVGAIERFGSPMMLRVGRTPIPMEPRPSFQRKRRAAPLERLILDTLADREMSLGQISGLIARPPTGISSTLLRMCSKGILIRRRMLGEIDGNTQKREFYIYRRA